MPFIQDDKFIDVNGINTRYRCLGDAGSPVVFLHGLGGYLECWRRNLEPIAREHRVYALDLPGHGLSAKPRAPYTADFFAGFVRDFLAAQGIGRAGLIGLSFGGAVALRFAVLYPEAVSKLVLAGSAGLGPWLSPALRLATLPLLGEIALRPSRGRTRLAARMALHRREMRTREWIDLTYGMMSQPGVRSAMLKILRNHVNLCGLKNDLAASHQESLASLAVPVLIVHGREDRIIPVANALAAQDKIPGCRVAILERCGHELQYECAGEFNRLALEFLRDRPLP